MEEIWKDVPNYEGMYQVSNIGRVKSIKFKKHKILKHSIVGNGYYQCSLWNNSINKRFYVHTLVSIAFLGHKPNGRKLVVDHINNVKTDNRVENLQIITQRENLSKDRHNKTSKYTGVSWHKASNKWLSKIRIKGKYQILGYFNNEYKAHLSYQNELAKLEK